MGGGARTGQCGWTWGFDKSDDQMNVIYFHNVTFTFAAISDNRIVLVLLLALNLKNTIGDACWQKCPATYNTLSSLSFSFLAVVPLDYTGTLCHVLQKTSLRASG